MKTTSEKFQALKFCFKYKIIKNIIYNYLAMYTIYV